MAEELYDTDARAQKAYRRVIASARKLAKAAGNVELGEAVANASHFDPSTREMRRYEALADLLEAVAAGEAEEKSTSKPSKTPRESE